MLSIHLSSCIDMLSAYSTSLVVTSDSCLDQIYFLLNDTVSPMLKVHSVVISSLVNTIHQSEASDVSKT